jgi:outer membrane protein insertion porin family
VSRYERIGYPFASVEIKSIAPYREGEITKLRITLSVDEGSKVQINEIRISGNKETKDNVILRETRIKLGETYDQERINQIQHRLNRLNIFSSVNAPELYVNSVGGGLLISVQEGNTNTFDGIIGYVPAASQGDQGVFTGLVNVTMRNLFGTARKLNVHWQRDDRSSQEVLLQYVEPWIFEFPLNFSGSFYQRQQDTTYVQRSVETKAELLVMESFSFGGLFTHESIIPSSTTAGQTVLNSRTITTGVEIRYDTRDDIYNPTSGVNYRSDYRIGKKKIFGLSQQDLQAKENSTVQKISLDAELFVEPFHRQVFAVGLHGRQLTNDQIELGDLYRFGGAKTLRGFRENQFLGSRIAWTNTEYRFLLARRTFFFGFFDTGYYFLPGDDVKGISSTQHLKYGYGIGVRLETSLGNLGVSFALGEGDTFAQGKIHFGLVNEF